MLQETFPVDFSGQGDDVQSKTRASVCLFNDCNKLSKSISQSHFVEAQLMLVLHILLIPDEFCVLSGLIVKSRQRPEKQFLLIRQ